MSLNINLKTVLGIVGGIAVLAIAYAAVMYANAYSSSIQPGSFRSFAVSGEGKIVVVPDVAQVSFNVISEGGKDIAALQKQNTDKVNKAIDFVKGKGVDSKDIKTESYNLNPRYQSYNCRPQNPYETAPTVCPPSEIVGYTITQSVSVKIRDFAKIGEILSGVVNAGANSVNGPYFVVDDATKSRDEARAQALKKAQESAKAIARAGGFSLGRLLSIDESGYPSYYDKGYLAARNGVGLEAAPSAPAPSPTIEPGSQDVNVTVVLRYEIR